MNKLYTRDSMNNEDPFVKAEEESPADAVARERRVQARITKMVKEKVQRFYVGNPMFRSDSPNRFAEVDGQDSAVREVQARGVSQYEAERAVRCALDSVFHHDWARDVRGAGIVEVSTKFPTTD